MEHRKHGISVFLILICGSVFSLRGLAQEDILDESFGVRKVASECEFTEGPVVAKDGTLYFSQPYASRYTEADGWEKPEALLAPVNSYADDVAFIMEDDRRHGYMASTRTGGVGGFDLYELKIKEPFFHELPDSNSDHEPRKGFTF